VRLGRNVAAPFTAYLLRPVIYLPLDLLTQLPRDQVDALLAHELAHIRRLDWLWNLAQSAIEAVLFYHPAMWWLSRRIRQEREHACDAMAAAACGSPIPLAEALAGLQRGQRRFAQHGFALGAGGGTLTTRIRHLLSGDTDMPSGRAMGALLLLCGLCLVPGALLRAPLNLLVNVHVDESAHGPLAPGGFREIRARYLFAAPRYYRLSTGPDGMPHEVFREGGVDRPIDGSVRNWVSATGAMHEPFSQPNAAKMAGLADSITSDARVLAVTGAPAAVVPGSLHAQMEVSALPGVRLWGIGQLFGSRAGATAAVVGPKGRVQVAYRGEAVAERWRAVALSVVPAAR
jgi:hypothetical protein